MGLWLLIIIVGAASALYTIAALMHKGRLHPVMYVVYLGYGFLGGEARMDADLAFWFWLVTAVLVVMAIARIALFAKGVEEKR